MKSALLFLFLLLICFPSFGQEWQWATSSNSTLEEAGNAIAKDEANGFIYVGGKVVNSGILPILGLTVYQNGFLAKYDLAGNQIWTFQIGGSGDDEITGIAVDESTGFIYVTGYINEVLLINNTSLEGMSGGISGSNINFEGGQDAFVACYNPAGQLVWYKIGGGFNTDAGLDIALNQTAVFATGYFENSVDFGTHSSSMSINSIHNFVVAYDLVTGNELWLTQMGSEDDDFDLQGENYQLRGCGITADDNGIYTNNYFRGDTYVVKDATNGTVATITDPDASEEDFIVCAFDNSGNYQWHTLYNQLLGASSVWGLDITNDCEGVYVTGSFHNGSISPSGQQIISAHDNPVISRLDKASGNETWIKQIQSNDDHFDFFTGIETDESGKIILTGIMNSNSIEIESPSVFTLNGDPDREIMIIQYENDGTFISAERLPSTGDSWGLDILYYENESFYIAGVCDGSTQFGSHTTSNGTDNYFIARHDLLPIFSYENPADGSTTFCEGQSNAFPIINFYGGGLFNGPGEIDFVNDSTGEINLSTSTPGGPYIISYTSPINGCLEQAYHEIIINILPQDDPTFGYVTTTYCQSESDPIPNSITTPGGTFSESSGNLAIDGLSGEIDLGLSSTGTYWVKYTTNGVCPNEDSVQITINIEDNPAFGYASTSYCQGDIDPAPNSISAPGGTFTEISGNLSIDAITGTIDLGLSNPGSYWIKYTTNGLCPNDDSLQITIHIEDDPTFSYVSSEFCQAGTNEFPLTIANPGGVFTGPTELFFEDNTSGELNLSSSTFGGPYTISYTTPGPNCPNTATFNITIHEDVDSNWTHPGTLCSNEPDIDLNSLITGSTGGIFSGSGVNANLFSPSNAGVGIIDITYTVGTGSCQETLTQSIEILESPEVSIGPDLIICGLTTNINVISNGIGSGQWSNNSGAIFSPDASATDVNVTVPNYGTHLFTYSLDQSGVCSDRDSIYVAFDETTYADAGPDKTLFFEFETELEATSPSIGSGNWSALDQSILFDNQTNYNAIGSNLKIGENTLIWSVQNGVCPVSRDSVLITIEDLWIPSGISPNGDNENDFFRIKTIDNVDCEVQFFNRWGQLVYENNQYENDWQGTNMKGQPLDDDTYFYIITINNELNYKGYLVLKR